MVLQVLKMKPKHSSWWCVGGALNYQRLLTDNKLRHWLLFQLQKTQKENTWAFISLSNAAYVKKTGENSQKWEYGKQNQADCWLQQQSGETDEVTRGKDDSFGSSICWKVLSNCLTSPWVFNVMHLSFWEIDTSRTNDVYSYTHAESCTP